MSLRSLALAILLLTTTPAMLANPAAADDSKNLTMIVPLGTGGALDRMARQVADHLPEAGYNVTVENRVIKGDSDGYRDFLERPADGSTVLAWFEPAAAHYGPGFQLDDLTILNVQEIEPPIFAARADLGWKTFEDFVRAAREKPGTIRIGAGKAGGNLLLMARQFEALGIKVSEVDYASGGKARKGLLNGEIELTVGSLAAIQKLGDKAVALAVMAHRRFRLWPEIPSVREAVAFAGARPIYGPSYRFLAVRREVQQNYPARFNALVSALEHVNLESQAFLEATGGVTHWFGPLNSRDMIAKAHDHFLELRRNPILPAQFPRN